jgi:hypothetical protein
MLFWGAGLSPSQRTTPEPRVHPKLTTARSGSFADQAFRDDMAKAAAPAAPYRQPERRPNADH